MSEDMLRRQMCPEWWYLVREALGVRGIRRYSLKHVMPELHFKVDVKINQTRTVWAKGNPHSGTSLRITGRKIKGTSTA